MDIINILDGLYGRATNGPMHKFSFFTDGGFTGAEVEMLMRKYGIRIWNRDMSAPHELGFSVRKEQAPWAEYVLCRAGVPLSCELLNPKHGTMAQSKSGRSMPKAWTKNGAGSHTFVDKIVDGLNALLG